MNWITIALSMIAAASLSIAGVYLLVWFQQRESREYLMFVLLAISTACIAATELWMTQSATIAEYGTALRWFHVPVSTAVFSCAGFVYYRFGSNRHWLGWAACALRSAALVINFVLEPNINYLEISQLEHIEVFGATVANAVGISNPWMLVPQLSYLFLAIYVLDAAVYAWRREKDRFILWLGGVLVFLIIAGAALAFVVFWEILQIPVLITPFFLGFIIVMGMELGREVLRAVRLDQALRATHSELRESEQRLSLAADAADAGLWSFDRLTGDVWATPNAREFLAVDSAADLSLDDFLGNVHRNDQPNMRELADDARRSKRNIKTEFRVVAEDGSIRWLSVLASWRFDEEDRGVLTGVVIDITSRIKLENATARQKKQLAYLSRAAAISELSASLAHEINQPLAIVLSNAEAAQKLLTQDAPDIAEIREIIDDIIRADRRAADVISGLRSLMHQDEPDLKDLLLNDVVTAAVDLQRDEFNNQDVSVDLNLAENLSAVRADRILLVQSVINLLTNACDAVAENAPGQRNVKIATTSNAQAIELTVSDNGTGLPQDPAQLFDPFFTTKTSGLGMGLTIVQSIATAFDGRIWADSDGRGCTTFHLSLPRIMKAS
jgi:PAS domain S-box-containing protein